MEPTRCSRLMRSKPVARVASGLAAYGLTRETRSCHELKTRMSTTHRAVACVLSLIIAHTATTTSFLSVSTTVQ